MSSGLHTNYSLMEELIACKKAVGKVVSGAPNVSLTLWLPLFLFHDQIIASGIMSLYNKLLNDANLNEYPSYCHRSTIVYHIVTVLFIVILYYSLITLDNWQSKILITFGTLESQFCFLYTKCKLVSM